MQEYCYLSLIICFLNKRFCDSSRMISPKTVLCLVRNKNHLYSVICPAIGDFPNSMFTSNFSRKGVIFFPPE